MATPPQNATSQSVEADELIELGAFAASISRLRLRRARELPALEAMFADPAWDMLLDLFTAQTRSQRVSVSSLCIAANASTTTSLRWVIRLERRGAIRRVPDPSDARRSFVELETRVFAQMLAWIRLCRAQLQR